jgi:hypothetical protein
MANIHPQDAELYNRIKEEKVIMSALVWETIYQDIGDPVSAINLTAGYYLKINQSISLEAAQKILNCTARIKQAMKFIALNLHPAVKELLTHYVGNDTFIINVALGSTVLCDMPIEQADVLKIIECTRSVKRFLDKLREATEQEKGF